jgi:photosystem II stability/assembly factor-like uncharacterized protein
MQKILLFIALFMGFAQSINAQWQQTDGIFGGDAKSFVFKGTDIFAAVGGKVYLTQNNGDNWTPVSSGLPDSKINALALSGSNLLAAVPFKEGIYLSTNNDGTWTVANTGLTDESVKTLVVKGNVIFAGTDSGVFLSTNNGNSWTLVSTGLPNLCYVETLTISGSNIFAVTQKGLFVSNNDGSSWTENTNGNYWTTASPTNGTFIKRVNNIIADGTNVYALTNEGDVFKTIDNGASWTNVSFSQIGFNTIGATANNGAKIFAGTGNNLYFSTDKGVTWTESSGLPNGYVNTVAANGSTIVVGFFNRTYISTDNGVTWKNKNTGIRELEVYSMSTDGANTYATSFFDVFLSTNNGANGIKKSVDDGATWTNINLGFTNVTVTGIVINGTTLIASTYGRGVFYSEDNGNNWRPANQGLTNYYIQKLNVNGNYLLAGTTTEVFRRPLNEFIFVGTKENSDNLNCTISPNPVSNTLTINCSNALINKNYAIRNVLGQTIKTDVLTDNATTLNVLNLANGIYFLHIFGTNKTIKFVKE